MAERSRRTVWMCDPCVRPDDQPHPYAPHAGAEGFDQPFVQDIGRHYVPYVNHQYGRSGTLWEGRHKGSLVSTETYFLTCSRYIELNPVRAAMVRSPNQYRWSSYRANALGQADDLITPHDVYMALGKDTDARRRSYRELFRHHIDPDDIHDIRAAAQTGTPLGNNKFREQIERRLKQKIGQARRGRPLKRQKDAR